MRRSVPVESEETGSIRQDGLIFRWVLMVLGERERFLQCPRPRVLPGRGALRGSPTLLWPVWGPRALWCLFPWSSCVIFHHIFFVPGREGTINYFQDHLNRVFPPGGSILPAEDGERGEVTEAAAAFLLNPFLIAMWLRCQAYGTAAVVTVDQSQPACHHGAGCHQLSLWLQEEEQQKDGLEVCTRNSVLCRGSGGPWSPVLHSLPPSASLEESVRW